MLLARSPFQDARDFGSDGYSLRVQHKFSRHIKLLICVTLYNEDQETLGKTLLGICEVGRRPGGGWEVVRRHEWLRIPSLLAGCLHPSLASSCQPLALLPSQSPCP